MTLNQLSRALYLTNRTVRDLNAIKRGKGAQRIGNRILGRQANKMMKGLWFR